MRFLAVLCAVCFWLVPANHAAASTVYTYETTAELENVSVGGMWAIANFGQPDEIGLGIYTPVNPTTHDHSLGLEFGKSYDMEIRITVGDDGEVERVDCSFLAHCSSAPGASNPFSATYDSFGAINSAVWGGVFVSFSAATGGSYRFQSDRIGGFSDDNYDNIWWLGNTVDVRLLPATPVPLPASALLLGAGLVPLALMRRRRRNRL